MSLSHRMSKTPIYKSWKSLRRRCNSPKDTAYKHYGGRGITYDPAWEKFETFFADMGDSHKPGLEIDRIDVNGHYTKSNCRWATRKEQLNNTRRCHLLTYKGETHNITEWARKLEIPAYQIWNRLRAGWSVEEAFFGR